MGKTPKLTGMSCREIDRKLRSLGFELDHTGASSIYYYTKLKNGKQYLVQVHWHPKDRGVDIIKTILRNGEITREEWFAA